LVDRRLRGAERRRSRTRVGAIEAGGLLAALKRGRRCIRSVVAAALATPAATATAPSTTPATFAAGTAIAAIALGARTLVAAWRLVAAWHLITARWWVALVVTGRLF
jgi:hypothetical protein